MRNFYQYGPQNYWEKLAVEVTAGQTLFSDFKNDVKLLFSGWSIKNKNLEHLELSLFSEVIVNFQMVSVLQSNFFVIGVQKS